MNAARDPDADPPRPRGNAHDQLADAVASRIDADTARREADSARKRAEAEAKGAHAERALAESAAARAQRERDDALERVAELEQQLSGGPSEPESPGPELAELEARPATPPPTYDGPTVATPPQGEDVVQFAPRGTRAGLVVVLGAAALVAAGITVFEAYRDRLTAAPGVVAGVLTLVLVITLSRVRTEGTTVAIERGVVSVVTEEGRRRFDLNSPATMVEMVGQPGERTWKVLFLLQSKPPFTIDADMVDPSAFSEALRRWRPTL